MHRQAKSGRGGRGGGKGGVRGGCCALHSAEIKPRTMKNKLGLAFRSARVT